MAWIVKRGDGRHRRYKVSWREPDGVIRSKTFRESRAAGQYARQVQHDLDVGGYLNPRLGNILFREYFIQFMDTAGPPALATRVKYEGRARNHILPVFGNRPLNSITRPEVRKFQVDLAAKGLGPALLALSRCSSTAPPASARPSCSGR
jgi:hypothetical protein